MIISLTKKEIREQEKELIEFCKKNHCLMWNYMCMIEKIRNESKDAILGQDASSEKNGVSKC